MANSITRKQLRPDIATTLEALRQGEREDVLPASIFYGLADLTAPEAAQLLPVWDALSGDYRVRLMQRAAEAAETNLELHYRILGLIGLSDPEAGVRQAAIEVLWEDETLDVMNRLIQLARNDPEERVRAAALSGLGRYILLGELGDLPESETVRAQEIAIELLQNERQPVEIRRRALEAIANCSHEIVPGAIQRAYRSADHEMHVSAVFAMGRTCDDRWEDLVMQELDSEDAEMRYEAARAAGEIELTASVPRLAQLLTEDDREIREIAVWSLGEIGGKEATRILRALLEVAEEEDDEVLVEAVEDALSSASLAGGEMFAMWDDD